MATTRVIVPGEVRKGVPFEVKALITHPMETGFRKDAVGEAIPRNIVTGFTCTIDGEVAFRWEVFTGVAANPFIAFWTTAERSGELVLTWEGMNGLRHSERRRIIVT